MKKLIKSIFRRTGDFSSKTYWNDRYSAAGNSGAGSYGRLADNKASVLNAYVDEHDLTRVLELGCGDGNQLSLANYREYLGIDVSSRAVELCREKFNANEIYAFQTLSDVDWEQLKSGFNPEFVMSLDVLFHLTEDEIFHEYMTNLFRFEDATVVIYSSNGNFKVSAPHIRNHVFTDWIAKNAADWVLLEKIDNAYPWDDDDPANTSFCDFYFYRKRVA